jgi:signal transduction histidine kinase
VSRRTFLLDAGLAAALVLATLLVGMPYFFDSQYAQKFSAEFGGVAGWHQAIRIWWAYGALCVAGLLIQHRWPLPALVLATAGAAGHLADPAFPVLPTLDLSVPIVLFTMTASSTRRRWLPWAATLVLIAGVYLDDLVGQSLLSKPVPGGGRVRDGDISLLTTAFQAAEKSYQMIMVLVLALALGTSVRNRREHLRTLEQRAADLERERDQRAALATAAERARISRELHDVVAHGLSVIVVQAQGAAAALERHPERTAAALRAVIATGRDSLAEMRRLLGVARRDPAEDPQRAPQPGIGALPALVDQVRAAGTTVTLRIDGDPVVLPAGLDLSVYRIVQEALTNTIKHAGAGARATVALGFAPQELRVEVTDDGAGPAPSAAGEGNGLRGIAERVTLFGGELVTGPAEGGGFRVRVALPLEPNPVQVPA